MNFNQCLIDNPAENAPYLTACGILVIAFIFIEIALSILCFAYERFDAATFLAASAVSKSMLLAFANLKMTASWRALRNNIVSCSPSLASDEMTQNSSFHLKLQIQYPLTHDSNIEAIRWVHTDNLIINNLEQEAFHLSPCTNNEIVFSAKTLQAGYGKILGLAIMTVSPLHCFRAENHIEFNLSFSILPPKSRKKRFHSASFNALTNQLKNKLLFNAAEYEPEELRPWQNTDAIRRIAWKCYAKSGKLMAWHNPGKTKPSLVCLIDAGPSMRLTRPDHDSCLSMAMTMMSQISRDYRTMTVIAYNESSATVIAENASPAVCIKKSLKWLLKILEWNPENIQNTELWGKAIQMIHNDFKLYKHVNFTRKEKKHLILDNKALVEWAKTDLALTAVDAEQHEKASQILKMSSWQLLISLIKQRSRTTQPPLMPSIRPAALSMATDKLKKISTSDVIVWFSDFAAPLSDEMLNPFVQRIKKQRSKSVAVCLPPPDHALNYISSHGEKTREQVFTALKKDMIFLDSELKTLHAQKR